MIARQSRLLTPDEFLEQPETEPYTELEVLSKGQSAAGQQDRLAFLREQGVTCTLLIDPESRTVEVHDSGRTWVASAGDEVVLSGLGGFSFRVGELFA
jgi:Uma2 family endonuclease